MFVCCCCFCCCFFLFGFLETDNALSRYSEVTNNNLRKPKLFVWCVVTVILVVNVEKAARTCGVVSNRIHVVGRWRSFKKTSTALSYKTPGQTFFSKAAETSRVTRFWALQINSVQKAVEKPIPKL